MKGKGKHLRYRLQGKTVAQARAMAARLDGFRAMQLQDCLDWEVGIDPEHLEVIRTERVARVVRNTSVDDARQSIRACGRKGLAGLKLALVREQRSGKRAGLIASLKRRIREVEGEGIGTEDFYTA